VNSTSQSLSLGDFFSQLSGATEISELYITLKIEQNIVTLNISVDNVPVMQEL
jgi:hypothetical protein